MQIVRTFIEIVREEWSYAQQHGSFLRGCQPGLLRSSIPYQPVVQVLNTGVPGIIAVVDRIGSLQTWVYGATTRRRKVDPSFLPDDLDKSTDDLHRSSLVLIHLHNSRAQNAKPNRKRVSMGTAMTVPTLWLPSRMSAWACAPTCASYPPPKSSRSRWWTPSPWM